MELYITHSHVFNYLMLELKLSNHIKVHIPNSQITFVQKVDISHYHILITISPWIIFLVSDLDFNVNLISVANWLLPLIVFSHSILIWFEDDRHRYLRASRKNDGLYILSKDMQEKPRLTRALSINVSFSTGIWYQRFGHPSIFRYDLINKITSCISMLNKHYCHECPIARFTRLFFTLSNTKTSNIFELLHIKYVWNDYHYFTFLPVDDYDRDTWTLILNNNRGIVEIWKFY